MSGTFWALALLCASGRPPPSRTAPIDTAAAPMMRRFIYPPEPARVGLRPAPAFAQTRRRDAPAANLFRADARRCSSTGESIPDSGASRLLPGDELAARTGVYRRCSNGIALPLQVCNRNREELRHGRLGRGTRR